MGHEVRIRISIPFPSYIPRARGIHAVDKFGTVLKAKCSLSEFNAVQEAADKVGVSRAEFIRWCCVHCALEVNKDVPDA